MPRKAPPLNEAQIAVMRRLEANAAARREEADLIVEARDLGITQNAIAAGLGRTREHVRKTEKRRRSELGQS